MPSGCSLLPTWGDLTFCDPMKGDKDNPTTRRARGEWVPLAGKSARWRWLAWALWNGARGMAVLSRNGLTHPLTFVALSMPARRVMSSVMIARPILTRGGGGRDATRASHKRSHSAPGNFIAMASTPDASRLRREADFRGPKKEGGAGGGLAPSATNQPSIRAAVLSGQSHTTL